MTLDGLTLHAAADELNKKLENGKIQKVLMPGKQELALQIYSVSEGTMRLVLSADAGDCAVYLTENSKPNPKSAPAFCMFLRKHLVGAVIRRVEQSGLDRILTLHLETKDELFRPVQLKLIAEIMGKYSNIILTDEGGRILDSIKRISADVSRMRTVLPGVPYTAPPQHKLNPLTASAADLESAIAAGVDTKIDRRLTAVLDGVSRQTAEEILGRSGVLARITSQLDKTDRMKLAQTVQTFFREATESPAPSVQLNAEGVPVFFSLVPYREYPAEGRREFDSVNGMLDYFYTTREELARVAQAKGALERTIDKHLQKLARLIRVYESSIDEARRSVSVQARADLITANLYRLQKGMTEFTAQDFETGKDVRIALDPSRTPSDTAQQLYRRIAKCKRAAAMNSEKLKTALEEQDFLLGALHYTGEASSIQDITQIKESLADAGYMPRVRSRAQQASSDAEAEPLRFTSPSGYTVYVGRNDRQNEYLTHRMARKEDIWFHAQKIPGSHVILETRGTALDDIDDESIVFAAELAARHSRAKRSGKTPVDYTQRRNVKKPPQSRPGKVIYDDYYTVYVNANTADPDA